jgi:hypothetical protein
MNYTFGGVHYALDFVFMINHIYHDYYLVYNNWPLWQGFGKWAKANESIGCCFAFSCTARLLHCVSTALRCIASIALFCILVVLISSISRL